MQKKSNETINRTHINFTNEADMEATYDAPRIQSLPMGWTEISNEQSKNGIHTYAWCSIEAPITMIIKVTRRMS